MSFVTWLIGGISGLTGLSSMAAFLVHLFSGNPDMALQSFMGLGGSVAIAWMLIVCTQARAPKGKSISTG
jgi:hypothetical protein